MKVLHLDSGMDWRGGQQQLYYLVTGLKQPGVEQHLALREGGELAVRIRRTKLPLSTLSLSSEWSPASLLPLAKIAQRFSPDIIHAHDSRTLGLAVILKVFGEKAKLVAARRVPFRVRKNPFWKFKYQRKTDKIIAVSLFIRDLLMKEGIDPERIEVVYDGFDWKSMKSQSSRAATRQSLGVAEHDVLIGTVGHFAPEKGHEFLIRAFRRVKEMFPNARLIIVGDGPLRGNYQRLIDELQLKQQILLPGFIEDLRAIFPALDLFVFPSLEEGLGSTLLMAMAHQIPVCASRTGGIPELIVEGQTGFLFPPGNAPALAEAIIRALKSSELAQLQSRHAFDLVQTNFPVERMIAETYQIYSNVVNR